MLDFSDRTRTGMFNVIWPLASSTQFFPFDNVLYVAKSSSCFYWSVSKLKWPEILSLRLEIVEADEQYIFFRRHSIKLMHWHNKWVWYAMTCIVYCINSSTMIVYQNENQAWHSGNTIYSKIRCKQNVVKQRGKLSIDSNPYSL